MSWNDQSAARRVLYVGWERPRVSLGKDGLYFYGVCRTGETSSPTFLSIFSLFSLLLLIGSGPFFVCTLKLIGADIHTFMSDTCMPVYLHRYLYGQNLMRPNICCVYTFLLSHNRYQKTKSHGARLPTTRRKTTRSTSRLSRASPYPVCYLM